MNSQSQGDDSEHINKKKSADVTDGEPLGTPTPSSSPTTTASSAKVSSTPSTGNSTTPLSKTDINPSCKSGRLKNPNPKRYKFRTETKSTTNSRVGDALREAVVTLKHATKNVTTNEFIVFGQSVGIQLSKLPLHTALQLQFDIQSLITKASLRVVSETTLPLTQPANLISPSHSTSSSYPSPAPTPFQPETVIPSRSSYAQSNQIHTDTGYYTTDYTSENENTQQREISPQQQERVLDPTLQPFFHNWYQNENGQI